VGTLLEQRVVGFRNFTSAVSSVSAAWDADGGVIRSGKELVPDEVALHWTTSVPPAET